jgi:DNA-binding response OmpR family regulator
MSRNTNSKTTNRRPNVVVILDGRSDTIDPRLLPVLEQAGYSVHPLASERPRLPMITRLKPLAVLFNVARRDTNAYELAAAVREELKRKGVVRIGIFGADERTESPDLENFDYCFVKPVNEGSLLAAINRDVPAEAVFWGPRAVAQTAPHRTLIIDDHIPLAEATAEFMRCEGLQVRIASTGRDALEIAAAFRPEIVLCDIMLPDMPGLDLAYALRASPGAKKAVIALHSAMNESDLRAFYSHAPVDMFLTKPLTKEMLDALLSKLKLLQRSVPSMLSRVDQKTGMLKLAKSRRAG